MTFHHPKYYAALRAERRKLQAASDKRQASSSKRQGPDRPAQPEVVLNKKSIDKDPDVGYCGTDDVTAIHGGHSSARSVQPKAASNTGDAPHMGPRNSAAETLHLEQHKYPGDGSSRMVQGYGPSSIPSSSKQPGRDGRSSKHQAPSVNMKNFDIVSGKDINKALEKMNNWLFRHDSNAYTTFNKVENALRKNWLWKTKEINKFKKILFKLQADTKNHE